MAAYDECLLDAAKTGDLRFRVCDAGTAYGNFEESCSWCCALSVDGCTVDYDDGSEMIKGHGVLMMIHQLRRFTAPLSSSSSSSSPLAAPLTSTSWRRFARFIVCFAELGPSLCCWRLSSIVRSYLRLGRLRWRHHSDRRRLMVPLTTSDWWLAPAVWPNRRTVVVSSACIHLKYNE